MERQYRAYIFADSGVAINTSKNDGTGEVRITTSSAHGFSTGNIVRILSNSIKAVNTTWTITVINATAFDLDGSTYTA